MSVSCGFRDLPRSHLKKIQSVLARYPQVEAADLFGSRAKGTARPGSDIDIALKGSGIHLQVLNGISRDWDDLHISTKSWNSHLTIRLDTRQACSSRDAGILSPFPFSFFPETCNCSLPVVFLN